MFCRGNEIHETKLRFEKGNQRSNVNKVPFGGRFGRFSNNWDRFGKGGRMEETKGCL